MGIDFFHFMPGIMEKNTFDGCAPDLGGNKDTAPGSHYESIPTGCRVSNGLGLTVIFCLLFLLFALRNKKLKLPPSKTDTKGGIASKTSFTGTSLSPLFGSSSRQKPTDDDVVGSIDGFDDSSCATGQYGARLRTSMTSSDNSRPRASSIA